MAVVILPGETWEQIDNKRTQWSEEMEAVKNGKVVFVPIADRRADTLRITLYEAAKRAGLTVSVRSYDHEGVHGFAVKARS
jgi:beta-lactamase class A